MIILFKEFFEHLVRRSRSYRELNERVLTCEGSIYSASVVIEQMIGRIEDLAAIVGQHEAMVDEAAVLELGLLGDAEDPDDKTRLN